MKLRVWWMSIVAAWLVACGGGNSNSDSGGTADSSASGTTDTTVGGNSGNNTANGYQAGPGPQGGATLYSGFRSSKKLVLHQRSTIAITPASFRDRLTTMEAAIDAFDGVFLKMPTASDAVMRNTALAAATIATDLAPLYALKPTKLKYNFAMVTVKNDLDPFDDWTTVLANFSNLAKVARDAGLVGIVIDNEDLGGLRANYPYDVKVQTKSADEYRAQTQAVSKRIMQAITAEFPDAVVVVLRGPAGAEPKAPANLVNCESRDPANAAFQVVGATCGDNPTVLLGPFFAGFVEGNGARSLVVDGGTDYGLRTAEQFSGSATWRKTTIAQASTGSAFMSPVLRGAWPAVSVSFGVRELDGARGNLLPNVSSLFAATLSGAMQSSNHFAWASFDVTDMTKVGAGNEWAAAARSGKAAGLSTSTRLASAAAGSGTGLMAQYFAQTDESELLQTIVDATVDFEWNTVGPTHTILGETKDNFSVVWTGYIEAPANGMYTFVSSTDDGMTVTVDGTRVVDRFFYQGESEQVGMSIALEAGKRYPITIHWFQGNGGAAAHVWWIAPGAMTKALLPANRLYPVY